MANIKETIVSAKTIDAATAAGAEQLGVSTDRVSIEIIEEPKKGILGIGAADAKVRVFYEISPAEIAVDFLETVLKNLNMNASVRIDAEEEDGAVVSINGDGLGALIGRHGDVLESLQYLTSLAVNKAFGEYFRISVDIENYRAKRAESLKGLAAKMSEKVLKYNRSFALEPMSSYERRIVHSACQEIDGVGTYSIGEGTERKVVIAPEAKIRKKSD